MVLDLKTINVSITNINVPNAFISSLNEENNLSFTILFFLFTVFLNIRGMK